MKPKPEASVGQPRSWQYSFGVCGGGETCWGAAKAPPGIVGLLGAALPVVSTGTPVPSARPVSESYYETGRWFWKSFHVDCCSFWYKSTIPSSEVHRLGALPGVALSDTCQKPRGLARPVQGGAEHAPCLLQRPSSASSPSPGAPGKRQDLKLLEGTLVWEGNLASLVNR